MLRFPALLFALSLLASGAAFAAERPNVLLIVSDDMGYSDAACYGGEIATPNLDALAKGGLRFSQFYNTARCWPSRAAVLTGYYAQAVRRDAVPGIPSGTKGTRPAWATLLPEPLRKLGYRSYHSGKWHIDGKPLDNGFDRSYSLEDHDRHFAPKSHTRDGQPLPPAPKDGSYYSSTAIADHAIECLREHAEKHGAQPFFEFLAFTAPHFPLQAPAEDIARYKDAYLRGWDAMREERWKRLRELGLGGNTLAPIEREVGPPYAFPAAMEKLGPNELNRPLAWDSLSAEQREFQAGKMAVHAAMVDRMDREIGRVLAQIRAMGAEENTLVLFLSDNGASAEIMVRGDGHDPHAECGTGATFLSLGPGWSSLANTPFRRHKTWVHEGGIATPLIVRWPRGIAAQGELRHTPGHVADIVPTVLELAGGSRAADAPPMHGKSLAPAFAKDGAIERESLWWLHEGNRALRVGDWKIVAAGKDAAWELYDLRTDRSETRNLAKEQPEKLAQLAAQWERETAAYAALAKGTAPASAAKPPARKTAVSIVGDAFHINGAPTYAGREWRGHKVEGMLMNSRMVQGIFDDLNPETAPRWAYPDTGKWDAERNTREFIAAMPEWKAHGLLAFTINLQGGSPEGYSKAQPWENSAFDPDGTLRPAYTARLARILDRADELGMVPIVGYFYFGQDQRLTDEAAVIRATDNATRWLLDGGWRNVLVEVNNECNVAAYDHEILKPARVHELIERVKSAERDGRRLLVSTSYGGGSIPRENVVRASDFLLLHGNGVKDPARIGEMVRKTREVAGYKPVPILFNEDDHFDFEKPENNFAAAVAAGASWGYFDFRMRGEGPADGYQSPPVDWGIRSDRKRGFFRLLAEITGAERGSK